MPELASFPESSRQRALQRFRLLRAHLEDGRSVAVIAREATLSYRTPAVLAGAAIELPGWPRSRKPRIDRGHRRKLSAVLQEASDLHLLAEFRGYAVASTFIWMNPQLTRDASVSMKVEF